MPDRVFYCRCEDVTQAEIDDALASGLTSVEEIKRYTGLGTGPCQGKECLGVLCALLERHGVVVRPFTSRPPSEPVDFATLATCPERDP